MLPVANGRFIIMAGGVMANRNHISLQLQRRQPQPAVIGIRDNRRLSPIRQPKTTKSIPGNFHKKSFSNQED
jgi:hypothetical protein